MFVLPPPPTYGKNGLYPNGIPGGLIETNNILEHPEGEEHHLVLGEGTYILRDDLQLSTPPPHPSDPPIVNNNPLFVTATLPTIGTRLSIIILAPKKSPQGLNRDHTNGLDAGLGAPPKISEETTDRTASDAASLIKSDFGEHGAASSRFGADNPALNFVGGKDAAKRKKPKNNIIKSNSSFVSRVIPHDTVQKKLNERDTSGILAFANISRAVQWLDLSSETKIDYLTKLLFTKANALCHDVNEYTKSTSNIDVLLGFNTADFIWYEPMTQKYTRLNKNGAINTSAVSSVLWLPGSVNLFVAAHHDGSLIVYDREKEDAPFLPEDVSEDGSRIADGYATKGLRILKSVQSRNQKTNPVAYWNLGYQKVNSMAFSPQGKHLAVVSEDGTLKIIDFENERVLDVYKSYYGGLICVTWSPDGRYILTGGQDDMVCIWSFTERILVARCQGHGSWVSDVKFDPWRCDERNYRFGSVGQDCQLLLWDFSVGMLGRPKAMLMRQRTTSVTTGTSGRKGSAAVGTNMHSPPDATNGSSGEGQGHSDGPSVHAVEPRANTAVLPPVMSKEIDKQPLTWLGFEQDCIMTVSQDAHVRTWDRPKEGPL